MAAALADDGRAIRLWIRDGTATRVEAVAFTPFLLAADEALVGDAAGLVALTRLEGAGDLRWLARFGAWSAALAARDRCREATGLQANAPEAPYRFFPDPVHQYLLMAGRTSFGGLRFGDLRRLALDIEVVTTEGYEFPSAAREGDRIVAIALADPVGFRHVLRGDRLDEPALLAECGRIIRERDPDVIEGHNVFRFDLEYIEARTRSRAATSSTRGCSRSCTTSARATCHRSGSRTSRGISAWPPPIARTSTPPTSLGSSPTTPIG